MTTKQPRWKLIAQLGDVNPVEYGGLFVYVDTTGNYPPEAEKLFSPDGDVKVWETRRFILEDLKFVQDGTDTYLVPARFDETGLWPYPASHYDEWFHKDLASVATYVDMRVDELEDAFVSPNPVIRARAWEALGDYHGWDNLDSYPVTYEKRSQLPRRFKRFKVQG
jgi:hypothetical protein